MIGALIYARYGSEMQNEQSIKGQLRICCFLYFSCK